MSTARQEEVLEQFRAHAAERLEQKVMWCIGILFLGIRYFCSMYFFDVVELIQS